PDHVDAHRSTAYVVGPYVKQNQVVSARYTTVNMLRTIEDILGMEPLNLNDADQGPMTEIFDLDQKIWSFKAAPSGVLHDTQLPINRALFALKSSAAARDAHPATYWAEQTAGYDWSAEDRIDADKFNRVLWTGLTADRPYPERQDRAPQK